MARINVVAARGTSQMQGLGELQRNLAELGNEVATKIGRTADRKAARLLADEVRQRAPHRPGVQKKSYSQRRKGQKTGVVTQTDYGDLRDNITVRLQRARKDFTITYTVSTGKAFWGFFLEYGTVNMAARPFMRPAFDTMVATLQAAQADELRKGIERTVKRMKVTKR